MPWIDVAHRLAAQVGWSVHRWPGNRFDAAEDALTLLRRAGFNPAIVIDGGSNEGQFAGVAARVFPEATLHLLEPQAECWPVLERFAQARGKTHLHKVAVTEPGVAQVSMHRGGGTANTGAFVMTATERFEPDLQPPATTLDALFASTMSRADRALLKLDIEGHEREALLGAAHLLEAVEVVYLEVHFYDVFHSGRPVFGELAGFLAERHFELYDFGMLSGRRSDNRLRLGDAMFVRSDSPLATNVSWE